VKPVCESSNPTSGIRFFLFKGSFKVYARFGSVLGFDGERELMWRVADVLDCVIEPGQNHKGQQQCYPRRFRSFGSENGESRLTVALLVARERAVKNL